MAVDNNNQKDYNDSTMAVKVDILPIHSGHFMVSRVHDDVNNDDDEEETVLSPFGSDQKGFNFSNVKRETQISYNFGNAGIDVSLTKLFECMTLAYSGTISSPRWKQFRGLHVTQKERIRLNNLIWREWHLQYIYHRPSMVCQFATPLSDDIHSKPEAVVLEGKYWKRRLDTVTAEYKKCRRYFKERINQQRQLGFGQWKHMPESELLEKVKEVTFLPTSSINQVSSTDLNLMQDDLIEDMDFNSELFSTLNQPFAFPNPRELNQLGYSEFIQPGLVQLQPNLEEFMDIDSMQELLSTKIPSSSIFTDPSVSQLETQAPNNTGLSLVDFLTNNDNLNVINGSGSSNTNVNSIGSPTALEPAGRGIQSNQPHIISHDPSLVIQQQQQQQQQLQQTPQVIMNASLLQQQSQQQQIINSNPSNITLQPSSNVNNAGDSVSFLFNNNSGQLEGNVTVLPSGLTISPQQQQQQFIISTQGLTPSQQADISNFYNRNNTAIAVSSGNIMGTVGFTSSLPQPQQSSSISSLLSNNNTNINNNINLQNNKVCLSVKNPTAVIGQVLPAQPNRPPHQQSSYLPHLQPKPEFLSQPQNASPSLTTLLQLQSKPSATNNSNQNSPLAQALARNNSNLNRGLGNQRNPQSVSHGGNGRSVISARKSRGRHSSGGSIGSSVVPSNASGIITDLAALAQSHSNITTLNSKKKDGSFAVPSVLPRKPRTIAPAPAAVTHITPPPQQQQSSSESYLAQLLKKGTYPGALINVKKEPQINPANPTSPASLSSGGRPTVHHSAQPTAPQHPASALSSQLPFLTQQLQQQTPPPPPPVVVAPSVVSPQSSTPTPVSIVANISGVQQNVIDITNMSHKELTNILNAISPPQVKTQPTSPTPPVVPSNNTDAKAMSPISSMGAATSSTSPLLTSSPITIKRSPSPAMDTGSLSEPSSPFTSIPMSPCSIDENSQSGDSPFLRENKKAAHLSAEQKRRFNLKMGFDLLQQLVPSLTQNPKVSKATMLQKTAEYCKKLKVERLQMRKEATVLKQEIESLNCAISTVQSQLPETGVPVTRQRKDQMKEMFDEYVRTRTVDNWKFWIFSVIMSCLYDSYCNTVSTVSLEELCRTSLTWVDQSCSLVSLRPNVLNALRKLSTTTSILTEPEKVKQEAIQTVSQPSDSRGLLNFLS